MAQNQAKLQVKRSSWGTFLLVAFTTLLLHAVPAARAEGTTSEQPRSFLVLGILSGEGLAGGLREHLTELIGRNFGIARAPALADIDLACRSQSCLEELPARTGWPNYIVAGEIRKKLDDKGVVSWHLILALYDVAGRAAIQDESEASSAECTGDKDVKGREACELQIRDLQFDALAMRLLRTRVPPPKEGAKYYSFSRGLAQGAFGGFAVAGLIAGAAVTHVNGRNFMLTEMDGSQTPITPQLGSYAGAGFGIMGAGLAGSLGTAIWGLWDKRGTSSRADRIQYLKGLLLGVSSSMLASSLIAASGLHANDGKNCVQDRPDVPCTFYPGPAGLGWGMTGVWTVGLAVSIGLAVGLK